MKRPKHNVWWPRLTPLVATLTDVVLVLSALCVLMWAAHAFGQEVNQDVLATLQASTPGTIFVTRNLNEADNEAAPGFMNHWAGISLQGDVIESQGGQGVIRTSLEDFAARPYDWDRLVILTPRDPQLGEDAAAVSETYVGRGFRPYSSILPRVQPGCFIRAAGHERTDMNCISVWRRSYEEATGKIYPMVGRPDRAVKGAPRFADLFTRTPDVGNSRSLRGGQRDRQRPDMAGRRGSRGDASRGNGSGRNSLRPSRRR